MKRKNLLDAFAALVYLKAEKGFEIVKELLLFRLTPPQEGWISDRTRVRPKELSYSDV